MQAGAIDLMLTFQALVAYNRTEREIADYLGADEIVFLDVDGENGLKAACIEAAQGPTPVENLEVGVFTGGYPTQLPDGYLDNLSDLRTGRGRQKAGIESIKAGGDEDSSVVASSGPAHLSCSGSGNVPKGNGVTNSAPDDREDIRYVVCESQSCLES